MSTSKTFRLFISSTFGDFRREREILQTKVFPYIRTYCSQRGFSFQPIDLRWGVSAEAQLDQKTLQLCLEEVSACKTYPHPNFLIMAGDRYGWVPLPYAIEEEEFKTLRELITKDNKSINIEYKEYKHYPDPNNRDDYETRQKATRTTSDLELLDQWYSLDDNQLTPSYILKEREKDGEYEIYENWEAEEGALRTILQSAVNSSTLTEDQKRKYFLSATEAEVEEGIIPYLRETEKQRKLLENHPELKKIDPQHIFGFFRDIDKSTQIKKKFIENDQDYEKAQAFKGRVRSILPDSNNVLGVKTTQLDSESLNEIYLIEFEEKMIAFLESQIDAQKAKEDQNAYTPLQIEQEAQSYYAQQKRQNFLKTKPLEKLLKNLSTYIADTSPSSPLVIYGPSGRGKSALMAQAISHAHETKNSKILYRFVGATPNSGSSKEILTSIFEQIGIDVRSEDDEETFEQFSYRIHDQIMNLKDTTIFIDAVDQLGNDDQFLWLPRILPSSVKIIISALEDVSYPEDSKYFQTLKQKTTNLYEIPEFNDPITLLQNILSHEERTLQVHQESYFLEQFHSSPSPLYITIAAQEMKHWKSTDTVGEGKNDQKLASSQKGIINEFISNLKKLYHHDEHFVQKVLGYLYASRDGLSESELLQLISTDKGFIQKMAPETWHENPTKELPMVHWSRLHAQLKPFLSIKRQDNEDLMYFFHREFEDVVKSSSTKIGEHEAIVEAIQKLIMEHQYEPFDSNRWGKLYATLITEYELRFYTREEQKQNYTHKTKQKWFAQFIVALKNEEWIYVFGIYLRVIGFVHVRQNRMYQGLAYEECNLQISEPLYEANHNQWADVYTTALNNLAMSYKVVNRINGAIGLEEKSLRIIEPLYQANPDQWAGGYTTALNNLAMSYGINNRVDESTGLQEKSLKICEALYQANPDQWAGGYTAALGNLARFYSDNNRLDEAIGLEEKCLQIREALYEANPDQWAEYYTIALSNLTNSYAKSKHLDEAIGLQVKSLQICEALYQANPDRWVDDYTIALGNVATFCYKQNLLDEAIGLEEMLLQILEPLYEANHDRWTGKYAGALGSLASSYSKNSRLDEAIGLEEMLLQILEPLYEANHDQWAGKYAGALGSLASSYSKNSRLDEAIGLQEKSLYIREPLYQVNPDRWAGDYTTALYNLANSYKAVNRLDEAIGLQEKLFQITEPLYEANPDQWAGGYTIALNNLVVSYKDVNRVDEAITLEEKCLQITEVLYQANPDPWAGDYAGALGNLAVSYYNQNRLDEAIKLEEKCLQIREALYEANPDQWVEDYTRALNNLASSYAKTKEYAMASKLFKRYFQTYDFTQSKDITDFIYPFIKWYQCEELLNNDLVLVELENLAYDLKSLYRQNLGDNYGPITDDVYESYTAFRDSEDLMTKEKYDIVVKVFIEVEKE